jgi:hypothetical protein
VRESLCYRNPRLRTAERLWLLAGVIDKIPISEIALIWRKKAASAVVEQFKNFVLANAA